MRRCALQSVCCRPRLAAYAMRKSREKNSAHIFAPSHVQCAPPTVGRADARVSLLPAVTQVGDGCLWPERTNVCCWHCCHPFDNAPLSIPSHNESGTMVLDGVFCSFGCLVAHIVEHPGYQSEMRIVRAMEFARQLGYMVHSVIAAPPRRLLSMFGGPYSIEQFREHVHCQRSVHAHCEPSLPYRMLRVISEEVDGSSMQHSAAAVADAEDSVAAKPDSQDRQYVVRGIRRPARDINLAPARHMPSPGLFEAFAKEQCDAQVSQPTAHHTRKRAASAMAGERQSDHARGLAKFMTNASSTSDAQ